MQPEVNMCSSLKHSHMVRLVHDVFDCILEHRASVRVQDISNSSVMQTEDSLVADN